MCIRTPNFNFYCASSEDVTRRRSAGEQMTVLPEGSAKTVTKE